MNYRTLGRSGLRISEVGFGAWAIGGAMWGGARDADAHAALDRALERGVNFIDTALVYGSGHSERLVGECLRRHAGAELHVATKVPPKNFQWPARQDAPLSEVFPAAHLRASTETSLRNLGVERINLQQLHVWADAWLEQDEWHRTLEDLRAEGKVRLYGVSINDHQPGSALRLVRSGRIDAVQVIHNVFDQSPEDALYPACLAHGVGVLARVPLDEGSLAGKLRRDSTFPPGDFRNQYFGGALLRQTVDRVEAVRPILEGAAGSMVRGALRYCLSHPAVTTVIPGMRSPAQADDNTAASTDGPLPPATLAALRPHRWVRAGEEG